MNSVYECKVMRKKECERNDGIFINYVLSNGIVLILA